MIVDFASPNYAKELHVGHFRSIVQGEAISRVLEALGYSVMRLSHVGDFGTPIGLVMAAIRERQRRQDPSDFAAWVQSLPLSDIYVEAKQRSNDDPAFRALSLAYCNRLQRYLTRQTGDEDNEEAEEMNFTVDCWHQICINSRKGFDEIAASLDITVHERGESFYAPMLRGIVEDLQAQSLVRESKGALLAFLDHPTFKPFLIRKSDGSFLYATTDLACLRQRVQEEQADWIVYVTDASQKPHFRSVFELAAQAGYYDPQEVRVDHVGFGLVRIGEDRKKVSSRDGSGKDVTLQSLLHAAVEAATARSPPSLDPKFIQSLGYSAVRYFDLSHQYFRDYTFDLDHIFSWKGNTCSYITYALARATAILSKAAQEGIALPSAPEISRLPIILDTQWESQLAHIIITLPDTLYIIESDLSLHHLCEHLHDIANSFHMFYQNCPVIDCPDPVLRSSRLVLCQAVIKTLRHGLHLLGINEPAERM